MPDAREKRCGFVVMVGRPNVGKSTFLNNILGKKVSIISNIPQTTRFSIRGIYNDAKGQIIFIDTPGIFISKKHLNKFLSNRTFSVKDEADIILYMVDMSRRPGAEEEEVIKSLKDIKKPVIMALNKRDLGQTYSSDYIELWQELAGQAKDNLKYYIPISALEKRGLDEVLDALYEYLPASEALYPEDMASDLPRKLLISDIIREKIFTHTKEELPHAVAVRVDNLEEKERCLYIQASVLVERPSQKAIIIGKKGQFLKEVGKEARLELEEAFSQKVYLDIWVKVQRGWSKDIGTLKELGYIV